MEFARAETPDRPIAERIKDFREVTGTLSEAQAVQQGARCMDCGIPFCHNGCPVHNVIPEWNDLVYNGRWQEALQSLHATNNFPDITGRICPAPCESSCVLGINADPVAIKYIERAIVDSGWSAGWIVPQPPRRKSGHKIAVIGSGPAGLAAAQQLARMGHEVDLYEKENRVGGLLRYGIPDFKLDKEVLDRRVDQMVAEGVVVHTNVAVGVTADIQKIKESHQAVLLALGAEQPRDLTIPGRELEGVHFALDFLRQQNHLIAGDPVPTPISAKGKRVVVIGGGDTGSDCVGTANRQGSLSVTQLEVLPQPPETRAAATPWPYWPNKLRISTSHEEGCDRRWSVNTVEFTGADGKVTNLTAVEVEWQRDPHGQWQMRPKDGSEFRLGADLILLAMGFVHPIHAGLLDQLATARDSRGNVVASAENYQTSIPGVFAAGDVRRGASLVVWAIWEGRQAAAAIDRWLASR